MPHSRSNADLRGHQRTDVAVVGAPGIASSQSQPTPVSLPEINIELPESDSGEDTEKKASSAAALASLFCWVAAEYYPRGSDDWTRCRNWVLSHPRLTHWYTKNGEQFAGFLNRHPLAHRLFQPVVKFVRSRGTDTL